MEQLADILLFRSGYNTNIVLASSIFLGFAAGVAGLFMLLRKRALVSDAVSHATLPGIAIGFLVALSLGLNEGRNLPTLLGGAFIAGLFAVYAVQWIKARTRLTEDTAIGTVLSVFYGLGIALLSYIQTLDTGSKAGLDSFLLGQIAAIRMDEAVLIVSVSIIALAITFIFFKEFALLCFDENFAKVAGYKIFTLDMLMMMVMLVIVCIGLKTVGLVLIIALLIIPPSAALLWTRKAVPAALIAGSIGAVSCYAGAAMSAYFHELPAGGLIILCAFAMFAGSLAVSSTGRLLTGKEA